MATAISCGKFGQGVYADRSGASYGSKTTRTGQADLLLVIYLCHPTFVGTSDGIGVFVKQGSQFAASTPLPAVMGLLPPGSSADMLRKGTSQLAATHGR